MSFQGKTPRKHPHSSEWQSEVLTSWSFSFARTYFQGGYKGNVTFNSVPVSPCPNTYAIFSGPTARSLVLALLFHLPWFLWLDVFLLKSPNLKKLCPGWGLRDTVLPVSSRDLRFRSYFLWNALCRPQGPYKSLPHSWANPFNTVLA